MGNCRSLFVAIAWVALSFAVCPIGQGKERDIQISRVPSAVIKAVKRAVPGIGLTQAEVSATQAGRRYEIEGDVDGKHYEIQVTEDGKVLGISRDD